MAEEKKDSNEAQKDKESNKGAKGKEADDDNKDDGDNQEESQANKKETEKKDDCDEDGEEEIFIPQAEYSAVCNADFLPMICNDFIQEFLDKDHGACQLSRTDAINLTRNFCMWIANNGLTCARI